MKSPRWLLALAATLLLAACDRGAKTSVPPVAASQPASMVGAVAGPQTTAAASDSDDAKVASAAVPIACSFMVHDGATDRVYDFPRARLRLTRDADRYTAVLYSDDPKAAINSDYDGNSFFLEMKLDIDDPAKLAGAEWNFKEPTSDPDETVNGIFLHGMHVHLQPADVTASLDGGGNMVQVAVWGEFFKFDNTQTTNHTPTRVTVRGEFTAVVDVKK